MPFNLSDVFERLYSFIDDRDASIKIRADRMDNEVNGIVDAINAITANTVPQRAPIRGVFGTALTPGYTFDGDSDTGIYRVGADQIGFSVGGVNVLTLDGTGISTNASGIAFTPAGNIAADNVQAAIEELEVDLSADISALSVATLPLAGGTMSGAIQMADQEISRPLILDYAIKKNDVGNTGSSTAFDLQDGNVQTATVDQNTTLSFINPLADQSVQLVLKITNGGAFTVTWPASVTWDGGVAPTLNSSGVDRIAFLTEDGGVTWDGFLIWSET